MSCILNKVGSQRVYHLKSTFQISEHNRPICQLYSNGYIMLFAVRNSPVTVLQGLGREE
jgi:hypothetical protein